MIDPNIAYTLGAGVLGGGIAWGGIMQTVKSLKETASEVKADLKAHTLADQLVQKELLESVAEMKGMLKEALK